MNDPPPASGPRSAGWMLAGGTVLLAVLLPWWRNHRYVSDFFDWSLAVAGAGKLRAGLRPYVDFSTPLQSLTFRLDGLAEWLCGERWLSLTYANALLIGLGFVALVVVWRRVLPRGDALLVAATLVMCSAGQHAVLWHNSLGLLCLALVLGVATVIATGQRAGCLVLGLGAAALWLGGSNKLNFHGAALGLGGLLLAGGWLRGRLPPGRLAGCVLGLTVFGLVLPPLTEIGLAGASWRLWWHNVFELPVGRVALLPTLFHPGFYLQPPADYYRPLALRPAGAIVVGLLLAAAALHGWGRHGDRGWRDRLLVTALCLAGAGCTLALMATNIEMVLVSAVAVVAVLAALSGVFGDEADRWRRLLGPAAGLVFLVSGWHSAWNGARLFYGSRNVDRTAFVSADDLPPAFAYLRGLRLTAERHAALGALAAELGTPEATARREHTWATGGAEWLERTGLVPTQRGLPLWLHVDVTLREADVGDYLPRLDGGGDIDRIVVDGDWSFWGRRLQVLIEQWYARRTVGGRYLLFERQPANGLAYQAPLKFWVQALSNVRSDRWKPVTGNWRLCSAESGTFVGCRGSSAMDLDFISHRLRGEAVARWVGEPASLPGRGWARVTAPLEEGRQVLWEKEFTLGPGARDCDEPFAIDPGGRPVRLEWEFAGSDARVDAGWRRVICTDSGPLESAAPAPLLVSGAAGTIAPPPGMFRAGCVPAQLAWVGPAVPEATAREPGGLRTRLDSEIWFPVDRNATRLHGIWVFKNRGQPAEIRVMWQKGGRLEWLQETFLQGPEPDPGALWSCALPEPVGWIGLIVTRHDGDPRDAVIEWRDLWWE